MKRVRKGREEWDRDMKREEDRTRDNGCNKRGKRVNKEEREAERGKRKEDGSRGRKEEKK